MKLLDKLIRYHKFVLDEKRRLLRGLEEQQERVERALEELAREVHAEQMAARAAPEFAASYGVYARTAIERRNHLQQELAAARERTEAAREELRRAFEELKKYEITRETRARAERAERDRRDQIMLDEIAAVAHRRRQAEGR